MFLICQRDMTAHTPCDFLGHAVIAHTEQEPFLRGTWEVDHGELPFPCLAQPTFLGEFLDVASTVSSGVMPVQGYEDPGGKQQERHDSRGNDERRPPATT